MSNNNSGKVRDILSYLVNEWHYCEGGWDENDVPLGVPEAEAKLEAYISSKVNEIEKAYGGCHNCYGKGYSTGADLWSGRGGQFGETNKIVFCECDRGKQLEDRIRTLKESHEQEQ